MNVLPECNFVIKIKCKLNRMKPSTPSIDSWLHLVGSSDTVLGPSRGHTPDISAFRIAYVYFSLKNIWLYGSVIGLPDEAESNGARGDITKFNLALNISVSQLIALEGLPELDAEYDDSMHNFQLARPVLLKIEETNMPLYPGAKNKVLRVTGHSEHLNFEMLAEYIDAYGGKHAKGRFEDSFHVGN
jgi:hypothetical protein